MNNIFLEQFSLRGLSILLLAMMTFSNCTDENSLGLDNNSYQNAKEVQYKPKPSIGFKVTFEAGHTSESCTCQGLCCTFVIVGGAVSGVGHVPCQGSGSACSWTINIGVGRILDETNILQDIEVTIEDFTGDFFLIPERSVYVDELELYFNIPEQIVYQVEDSSNYLLKGISLSEN